MTHIDIGFLKNGKEDIQKKGFQSFRDFRKFVERNKGKISSVDGSPIEELHILQVWRKYEEW